MKLVSNKFKIEVKLDLVFIILGHFYKLLILIEYIINDYSNHHSPHILETHYHGLFILIEHKVQ